MLGSSLVGKPSSSSIQSKQDVLLESLQKFYEDEKHLTTLTDVLRSGSGAGDSKHISLRILDWLVTNYAKKHNIVYLVPGEDDHPVTFNMFLEYKSQLKAYSKKFFDPFCRRERLEFRDAEGRPFHSTVGQLNFFRWALLHGVVEYGATHGRAIETDMLDSIRHRGATKERKRKRRELSRAAIKGCTNTRVKVTVRFT